MWSQEENCLYGSFRFTDFSEAFAFITQVALLAEKYQHHPTIKITFNKVELWLNTHDAGDIITSKDTKLAEAISELLA
ncbi:4a-hydroxytetrahydrobiopterin dehydratase [Sphingobacterium deserti]|uniref:4a-hydroxytetrahydrobiopterin dehydratase n=1 Tax=Sphingobacterium deserti TaxID=1229276 RepID=A0A0B8SZ97_9SPHI|nr:4a-hydroxytetrahydrobiopterin dehydratase [Sphingobacterium deserti]KGE13027.1 transcriptional coactivator/pterin dehydratase [Sphingobacterium deserti]